MAYAAVVGVGDRLLTRGARYRVAELGLRMGVADPVGRVRQWLNSLRDC